METKTNKKLLSLIKKWSKRTEISNFFINLDCQDKRYPASICRAMVDGKWRTILNVRSTNRLPFDIESVIIHELGHIKHRHNYQTKSSEKIKIKSEYEAEKFCYLTLLKYTPIKALKHKEAWKKALKSDAWRTHFPIHYEAFKKLYITEEA